MHSHRGHNDPSGRGHPQGRPCCRSTGWARQTPGYSEHPGDPEGYKKLVDWASEFGSLEHAGVEGTGSFGTDRARFLKGRGIRVSEVIRPKRRDQYRTGKSDSLDSSTR